MHLSLVSLPLFSLYVRPLSLQIAGEPRGPAKCLSVPAGVEPATPQEEAERSAVAAPSLDPQELQQLPPPISIPLCRPWAYHCQGLEGQELWMADLQVLADLHRVLAVHLPMPRPRHLRPLQSQLLLQVSYSLVTFDEIYGRH